MVITSHIYIVKMVSLVLKKHFKVITDAYDKKIHIHAPVLLNIVNLLLKCDKMTTSILFDLFPNLFSKFNNTWTFMSNPLFWDIQLAAI